MLSFIYNNQTIIIFIAIVAVFTGLYFSLKSMPVKVKKKENKKEEAEKSKDDNDAEKLADEAIKQQFDISEELLKEESKQEDVGSKRPKIVQVYKRREREQSGNDDVKQDFDPIYNRDIEFVNTSKNIAKFKSFAEETITEESEQSAKDEFGFVVDKEENCEFCEDKVKHFDHSKRLSAIMNEDKDIFASHITEKYMNINAEKHLKVKQLDEILFNRTAEMLYNSENKVQSEYEHSNECVHIDDCECEDEEVKINMKTALIADTYFNRKKRKK